MTSSLALLYCQNLLSSRLQNLPSVLNHDLQGKIRRYLKQCNTSVIFQFQVLSKDLSLCYENKTTEFDNGQVEREPSFLITIQKHFPFTWLLTSMLCLQQICMLVLLGLLFYHIVIKCLTQYTPTPQTRLAILPHGRIFPQDVFCFLKKTMYYIIVLYQQL